MAFVDICVCMRRVYWWRMVNDSGAASGEFAAGFRLIVDIELEVAREFWAMWSVVCAHMCVFNN